MKCGLLALWLMYSMATLGAQPSQDEIQVVIKSYMEAAKAGDPNAQLYTSYAYWNGLAVKKNEKIAKRWLEKSVEQEFPPAILDLGQRKLMGNGYARNVPEALNLLERASLLGMSEAQVSIGAYYLGFNSEDGLIDSKRGMSYLLEAESLGNSNAMLVLGFMYQAGVEPDVKLDSDLNLDQAIYWYTKSAERLNIFAIGNLGNVYSNPFYQNIDSKKAYFWYKVAKNLGAKEWRKDLIAVELRLSQASRNEMKQKAEEWVKTHKKTSGLVQ